jgi:hypothetical protein
MTPKTELHKSQIFHVTRLVATSFGLLLVAASSYSQTVIKKETTMSQFSTLQLDAALQTTSPEIRPFHIDVPEGQLTDLRHRIAATKWPERETVGDATQGVQLATMQKLARYWATDYDWRKCEAKLNALPQFVTNINGVDIHFIHVRSKNPNALPIIITHGWPGSIIEQLKVIGPLTDPVAYGGKRVSRYQLCRGECCGVGLRLFTSWEMTRRGQ